jgi:hypothetical protein
MVPQVHMPSHSSAKHTLIRWTLIPSRLIPSWIILENSASWNASYFVEQGTNRTGLWSSYKLEFPPSGNTLDPSWLLEVDLHPSWIKFHIPYPVALLTALLPLSLGNFLRFLLIQWVVSSSGFFLPRNSSISATFSVLYFNAHVHRLHPPVYCCMPAARSEPAWRAGYQDEWVKEGKASVGT